MFKILFVLGREHFLERAFQREGLDGFDGSDGFGGRRSHQPFALALLAGHFANAFAEGDGAEPKQGEYRERDQAQLPAHVEHERDHAHQNKQLRDHGEQRGYDHILEHADIRDHADDQVSGPSCRVEGQGEVLDVAIKLGAHLGQHAVAELGKPDGIPVSGQRAQGRNCDQGDRHHRQERHRLENIKKRNAIEASLLGEERIEDDFERPGFEQPQSHLREQGHPRTEDEETVLADLRPEMAEDSPEAGEAFCG